jgi:hypothetical protein
MKTTTRWILGIGLGLIVVACPAVAAYCIPPHGRFARSLLSVQQSEENGRVLPWRDMPRENPIDPFERIPRRGFGVMMRPNWGIAIFFLCGLALAGGLVAAAVVALARSSRKQAVVGAVPATVLPDAAAVTQPAEKACPNCGREVNADWQHCAYCGTNLTSLRTFHHISPFFS